MKKMAMVLCCVSLVLGFSILAMAEPNDCVTIQEGTLLTSNGEVIKPGFNQYGYNYQARITNQSIEEYCLQRNDIPETNPNHWDYEDCMAYFEKAPFELVMKWNDAWLSNKDCDGDGLLDRHYGYDSYQGSGAWLTNHQSGTYEDETTGKKCKWIYFVKIVAAPADAYTLDGYWYTADGVEIGEVIWGDFAIIEHIENDPCAGIHGVQYVSPDHAGLGNW